MAPSRDIRIVFGDCETNWISIHGSDWSCRVGEYVNEGKITGLSKENIKTVMVVADR